MPQERRYTRYKQADVFLQLAHYRKRLKVEIVPDSVSASGVSLLRLDQGKKLYRGGSTGAIIRLVQLLSQLS